MTSVTVARSGSMKKRKVCPDLDSDSDSKDGNEEFVKARAVDGFGALQKRRLYVQDDSDSDSSHCSLKATETRPTSERRSTRTGRDKDDEAGPCAARESMCPEQPVTIGREEIRTSCSGKEPASLAPGQPPLKLQEGQQMKRKMLSLPRNAVVIELEDSSSSEGHDAKAPSCQKPCDAQPAQEVGPRLDAPDDVIVLEDDDPCPAQVPRPGIKCRPKRKANRYGPIATEWGPAVVSTPDFADGPQSSSEKAGSFSETPLRHFPELSPQMRQVKRSTDGTTARCTFVGGPYSDEKARAEWPHRYNGKLQDLKSGSPKQRSQEERTVRCMQHFAKARVDGTTYELNDVVHFYIGKRGCTETVPQKHDQQEFCIGRLVEFMKTEDGCRLFSARRFLRASDTATNGTGKELLDPRRVFFSEEIADCLLSCIVEKVSILQIPSGTKSTDYKQRSTYYFDMGYKSSYSTFFSLAGLFPRGKNSNNIEQDSHHSNSKIGMSNKVDRPELLLLDLYSGCGAMSTGLCSGAQFAGANLVTKWAVDQNEPACQSLRHNHPKTEIYNMDAETFFTFVVKWQALFLEYPMPVEEPDIQNEVMDQSDDDDGVAETDGYEVEHLLAVRMKEDELVFKVRWKNYTESHDTWEPISNLCNCKDTITAFIWEQRKKKALPLPGEVDVVCGGPPCQGISGFNRYRNHTSPLKDDKNKQIKVFMDIVKYLKPRYVLMENVVDLLKFCGGVLGRYSLSRLVGMRYQASIGMLVAGSYGLPQYRMRVFLWGASPSESLPAYPLPTHNVLVTRNHAPKNWENNLVSQRKDQQRKLEKALVLEDAISDLPPVRNSETRDVMDYDTSARTGFQQFLRHQGTVSVHLYDHRPLKLKQDDLDRVCLIPKQKGANYRDLEGVVVNDANTASLREGKRAMLSSGKPLVPDYALSYTKGKSLKPFGRLWWDEIVSTVVTRAEPHNQAVLHPEQDRVTTIRENARLQGFPDYYQLFGDVKERYKQVGNAVAFPVSRALGYTLGLAMLGLPTQATMEIPPALYTHQG